MAPITSSSEAATNGRAKPLTSADAKFEKPLADAQANKEVPAWCISKMVFGYMDSLVMTGSRKV